MNCLIGIVFQFYKMKKEFCGWTVVMVTRSEYILNALNYRFKKWLTWKILYCVHLPQLKKKKLIFTRMWKLWHKKPLIYHDELMADFPINLISYRLIIEHSTFSHKNINWYARPLWSCRYPTDRLITLLTLAIFQ